MALLCEPYLLDPGPDGIHVIWHTGWPGGRHAVLLGAAVPSMSERQLVDAGHGPAATGAGWRRVPADTVPMSRLRDDADPAAADLTGAASVHRHLAAVTGLTAGRTPYRVVSVDDSGAHTVSAAYTLAPAAPPGTPVRMLLSSDHQLMPMVPANIAMVAATAGVQLDGVLMAGDLVNVADRASDWFDSRLGPAFFATMTGRADHPLGGRRWSGAPLLQHTPLFPAIGNHEVMGNRGDGTPLDEQFHASRPDGWNVTSYEELFPVPADPQAGPRRWARTVGDVHVIALFVTRRWQPDGDGATFLEPVDRLADPGTWTGGQFLYESVGPGSAQLDWLARQLAAPQCRAARYRVVMFHHPGHGLGRHCTPAFTDPVPTVVRDPATGTVTQVRYDYPLDRDQILTGVAPLLAQAGVHLVLTGHSHLWNRFRDAGGVHWLESSNVGNSYGAYDPTSAAVRPLPAGPDYVARGDPGGLAPAVPTVAPLTDPAGTPQPYLASNTVTAFSLLDSGSGTVRSYRFDTAEPAAGAVLFDEFRLD